MVVINSLRQLMRTPVKTLFFFVLLILTTAFFLIGFNLRSIADKNIQRIENMFITIGTVEQKATSLEVEEQWDAEKKEYIYYKHPVIGKAIPMTVLDFKGADYILEPEMRPFYCAYDPKYIVTTDPLHKASMEESYIIAEFQPLQDCDTGNPVHIRITKLHMGLSTLEGIRVLFCNHFEEKTYKLYAGKTYIAQLSAWGAHEGADYVDEFVPQYINMQALDEGSTAKWDEVTDNFFETPKGKIWLNYINSVKESLHHTIPVIPTNFTKLLMAFYNGDARIIDGRDIKAGEYNNGENVCLVQQGFAQKNGLKVGDSLTLPLIWTSYRSPAAEFDDEEFGAWGRLNEKGELYTPFDNKSYRIVGIYNVAATDSDTAYSLGGNAVIIPYKSVKNNNSNDETTISPMKGFSTSFQIPNGSIDKFIKAWEAQGIDDLDITFYDKGYSKIKAGLDDMKNMALIIFIIGAITTVFTVILFCHLFISKQRRRTAIERSLGLSKALCTLSMLAGVLIIVVPAYIIGSLTGNVLTYLAAPQISAAESQQAFDTTFSDWVNSADNTSDSATISVEVDENGNYLAGAAIIPLSLLISLAAIRANLKAEPLKLLGEKER